MNEAKTECKSCSNEYPMKEFEVGKRVFQHCADCRAFLGALRNDNRKKRSGGYTGKSPERVFELPPGCLLVSHPPQFAQNGYFGPQGLKFLAAPSGQLVVRPHKDDKPGEVCWVLG